MQGNILEKIKYVIVRNKKLCIVFLLVILIVTISVDTLARYIGLFTNNAKAEVANLIIETNGEKIGTNLARGKNIKQYFSISNYSTETEVTDVAYDYYIFIVDENDEIIPDAKLYKYQVMPSSNLITQDNPNTYVEVPKIIDGEYKDGFYGGELFLEKSIEEFRLEIDDIQNTEVHIKTIAVQKELTN